MPAASPSQRTWTFRTWKLWLAAGVLAGCGESPSFEMRWQIARAGDDPIELSSAADCSTVGIGQIRVSSLQNGVTVDRRTFPCYPTEFADDTLVAGPELPDGNYIIEFEPLSQAGRPFPDLDSTLRELSVAGASVTLSDIVLNAPPACADGIDNDVDGLVDSRDPSCLFPDGREDIDTTLTTFFVQQQLLGGHTSCGALDISHLELEYLSGEEPVRQASRVDCLAAGTSPVSVRLPANPEGCEADCYTWRLTAVDYQGQPLTQARTGTFSVTPGKNDLIEIDATLVGNDFVEPVASPLSFVLNFVSNDVVGPRGCTPPTQSHAGLLEIADINLRFYDQDLQELPLLDAEGQAFSSKCPNAPLTTETLSDWGTYYVGVEGLSNAGEVCFSNFDDPTPVGAHLTASIAVERAPGVIPASCVDCQVDADCGSCTECCIGGVCRLPTPCNTDSDCGNCENCCINNSCKIICEQDADCGACVDCCIDGFCE